MTSKEIVLSSLERKEGPVPWIEIETRDELISSALAVDTVGWPERVSYAKQTGMDAVGFAHWERFGCEVIKRGHVLGFTPLIHSRADYGKFRMPQKIDFQPLKDNVERAREAIGDSGISLFVAHVLCLDPVIMDMGFENFCIALYEDRTFIIELYKRYTEYYSMLDDFYSGLPEIDFIWVGEDIAHKTGTYLNPELFNELVLPFFREVTGRITKPWIYHSDGNIYEALPDLLTLGMKAIHPLQPDSMDILQVKKEYGDKVALIGCVDLNTLTNSTALEVEKEVIHLMDTCSPGGGYILSSSNSLASYVKPENVYAMGRAKREWNRKRGYIF